MRLGRGDAGERAGARGGTRAGRQASKQAGRQGGREAGRQAGSQVGMAGRQAGNPELILAHNCNGINGFKVVLGVKNVSQASQQNTSLSRAVPLLTFAS